MELSQFKNREERGGLTKENRSWSSAVAAVVLLSNDIKENECDRGAVA